jgi:hypothetical protein
VRANCNTSASLYLLGGGEKKAVARILPCMLEDWTLAFLPAGVVVRMRVTRSVSA